MKLMLDCRALSRLLSRSQDEALPLAIRARMRLHLTTCQSCRNVDRQVHFARKAMQALRLDPPAGLSAAEHRR